MEPIGQISDLHAHFIKHSFQKIPLLKKINHKTHSNKSDVAVEFQGCVTKAQLLRWYNHPYSSSKALSFNSIIQKTLEPTSLEEFILELESRFILNKVAENIKRNIYALIVDTAKSTKKDKGGKKFYLKEYLVEDFLTEFKTIRHLPPHQLGHILEEHEFPILVANRKKEIIYSNQKAKKIQRFIASGKKDNLPSLSSSLASSLKNPISKPVSKKVETAKLSGQYRLQQIMIEGAVTFMLTFLKVRLK